MDSNSYVMMFRLELSPDENRHEVGRYFEISMKDSKIFENLFSERIEDQESGYAAEDFLGYSADYYGSNGNFSFEVPFELNNEELKEATSKFLNAMTPYFDDLKGEFYSEKGNVEIQKDYMNLSFVNNKDI